MIFCGSSWKLLFDRIAWHWAKEKGVCPSPRERTVKHAAANQLCFVQMKFPLTFGGYNNFSKFVKL